MECDCDMSAEAFDSTKQSPKVLPCGHTACLQCLRRLPGRSCPTCRRDFNGSLEELPTNFSLLKLMEGMKLDSTPCAWCSDCRAAARPRCWEQAHDVLPVRRALRRHLQGALQQAAEQLQGLQDQCRNEQALAALTLLTGESWDVTLLGGDRELTGSLRNTEEPLTKALWLLLAARAGLTEDRAAARDPPPADAPTTAAPPAAVPPADAPTAAPPPAAASLTAAPPVAPASPPAAVPAAAAPPAVEPPAVATPAGATPASRLTRVKPPAVVRPTRVMNVWNISQSGPDDKRKVAALLFVKNVTRLAHVYCDKDPAWSLHLLWRAAPTVLDLSVIYPREVHLLAVHAMPRLRRLSVFSGDALDAQPPVLPALPPGHRGLQWLKVLGLGLPRATTQSLLRVHCHSLEELELEMGTPGDMVWPKGCGDLHSLLEQCGLRALRRLVLRRSGLHAHTALACMEQRAQVREVLPGVEVLCSECSYAKAGQEVFHFEGAVSAGCRLCLSRRWRLALRRRSGGTRVGLPEFEAKAWARCSRHALPRPKPTASGGGHPDSQPMERLAVDTAASAACRLGSGFSRCSQPKQPESPISDERILKNVINYHFNGPESENLDNLRRSGRQIASQIFLNTRELQHSPPP